MLGNWGTSSKTFKLATGVLLVAGVVAIAGTLLRQRPAGAPSEALARELRSLGQPLRNDPAYALTSKDLQVLGRNGLLNEGDTQALAPFISRD